MAVLNILTGEHHPILRKKTEKVPAVTKKILKLIRDMEQTMKAANGVGLAAPQVGLSLRICLGVVNDKITPLINPQITWKSEEIAIDEEGCLSLPGVWLTIPRSVTITLTYTDEKGRSQERQLSGFDARVVQHEVDHLDGVLITDRVLAAPARDRSKA